MKIEECAREILDCLSRLQGDFTRSDDFAVLGKHLAHAQSGIQNAEKRLKQFAQKLLSAHDGQPAHWRPAQQIASSIKCFMR